MTIEFGTIATSEVLEIVSIVEELRNTSATNGKIAILEQHKNNEGLKTVLELTYNPFKKYKITEKTLEETDCCDMCHKDLITLTKILSENNINDNLRDITNNFLAMTDEKIRDLYKGVLLKDLKLGVNIRTINKVWKGLIPTSETGVEVKPMLANKIDFDKPPQGEFAITEKLDGIRCIAICKKDNIQLYTRQGKLIEGCIEVEHCLSIIQYECDLEFVLDGELLAEGCTYNNVYKETIKRVKNKNEFKTGVNFVAFDILDIVEFENMKCTTPYYQRLETLMCLNKNVITKVNPINMKQVVKIINPLYIGADMERVLLLLEEYKLKGAEGLMINLLDAPYEFKRSKNILKVKVMQTVDLKIIGFEEGQGRNAGKLGALIVEYKGNSVGVGSGFTDYDREFIWNNQDQYLEKICEVQYFEVSKDKNGVESLRFPIYNHMRPDKTEPSLY